MTPRCHINHLDLILRSLFFMISHDFEKWSVLKGSYCESRNVVDTIGKSIKNYGDTCREWIKSWTWAKVIMGQRVSGKPDWRNHLQAICRSPVTGRRMFRTIMGMHIENESNDKFEPKLSWIKGCPGNTDWRKPLQPICRPLPTGRRVLRTPQRHFAARMQVTRRACLEE